MITIKLPYILVDETNSKTIYNYQREQSSVLRFAYNRFKDGLQNTEITRKIKETFIEYEFVDSWFVESAIQKAKSVYIKNKNNTVIFGGKKTFENYKIGKITKEVLKQKRLCNLVSIGEAPKLGNRKINLDIVENNRIILKLNKTKHIDIIIPKLKKQYKRILHKLENQVKNKELPFTIELNKDFIYIIFENNELQRLKSIVNRTITKTETRLNAKEKIKELTPIIQSSRILGLDLNPNYIGLSILEFINPEDKDLFRVLEKQVIDFTELNKRKGKNSTQNISINNKKKFETIQITHKVMHLAIHYKCSKISIEDLHAKSSNKFRGKNFNRLCNNVWHRYLFLDKLKNLCLENNIELVEVNPIYSSTIGNINYGNETTPDMVASSIEIARRGFKKFSKGWFYPELIIRDQLNLWKKEVDFSKGWVNIHEQIKKSKVKYRFPLVRDNFSEVFRNSSIKSKVLVYKRF